MTGSGDLEAEKEQSGVRQGHGGKLQNLPFLLHTIDQGGQGTLQSAVPGMKGIGHLSDGGFPVPLKGPGVQWRPPILSLRQGGGRGYK